MTGNSISSDVHPTWDQSEFVRMRIVVVSSDGGTSWRASTDAYPDILAPMANSKGRAVIALLSAICVELHNAEVRHGR
jgi:hypothetical protein